MPTLATAEAFRRRQVASDVLVEIAGPNESEWRNTSMLTPSVLIVTFHDLSWSEDASLPKPCRKPPHILAMHYNH